MNIKLVNGGEEVSVTVPFGATAATVRKAEFSQAREDVGAPSNYTLTVNGLAVEDGALLREGDRVGFRQVTGSKGVNG